MKDQLISFETAKLAKEKGFKIKTKFSYKQPVVTKRGTNIREKRDYKIERTNYQYTSFTEISYPNENYSAPTQSLLQKWLREVHNIHFNFINIMNSNDYEIDIIQQPGHIITNVDNRNIYEKIFEIGLLKALKLIK